MNPSLLLDLQNPVRQLKWPYFRRDVLFCSYLAIELQGFYGTCPYCGARLNWRRLPPEIARGCFLYLCYLKGQERNGLFCQKKSSKRFNLPMQCSKQVLEVPIFNAVSIKDCNYEVERVISQVIWKWQHRNGTKSFSGWAVWGPVLSLFHCKPQTPVCPFGTPFDPVIQTMDLSLDCKLRQLDTKYVKPFFLVWCFILILVIRSLHYAV